MAEMIYCRSCGARISAQAPLCPQCGAPQGNVRMAQMGDGIPRTFSNSVRICLRKYAIFRGRAPRAEYWYFTLFSILVGISVGIVVAAVYSLFDFKLFIVSVFVTLFLLLPGIAVQVRRLHDIDRSGWWYLLFLLPLIGQIIILIWDCTPGTRGDNRFGPENGTVENAIRI